MYDKRLPTYYISSLLQNHCFDPSKRYWLFLQIGTLRITYTKDPDLEYLSEITKTDMSFYDKAELNAFYRCAGMLKPYWFCNSQR